MKYIVLESQLNDVLYNKLKKSLFSILDECEFNRIDNFIIVWDNTQNNIEDDIRIEFDYWDGRLLVSKKYIKHLQDYFPFSLEEMKSLIAEWLQKRLSTDFDVVDVKYVKVV